MLSAKTILNTETYSENDIDLILFEAAGSGAFEEVVSEISFEWLLEYSNTGLENLV